MKKLYCLIGLIAIAVAVWFVFVKVAKAEVLTCPTGQQIGSVLVTPATPGMPAVPAVTHTERRCDSHGHDCHNVTVVDSPAIPAVPGTPAVYADQCVAIEGYVPPVVTPDPTPSAPVPVTGGGASMMYCSGPMAPGWNVSLPNGGCAHGEIAGGNSQDDKIEELQLKLINVMKQLLALLTQLKNK